MDNSQIDRLRVELGRKLEGEVLFDELSRLIYSTDASLYQIKPLGVVLPRTHTDLVQAVRTAVKYGVPLLPRGGGTSLAGQTVSPGLVLDSSKFFNRLLEVNADEHWAWVEPGLVLDELNQQLQSRQLFFAPDVATSSRATLGGMIGNNSAGVRSVRYGKTVDHVLEVDVILSTGEELRFGELDREQLESKCRRQDREGEIYRGVRELVRENRSEILERYPKVMRRVGGYNLDALLDEDRFNLASLIVGSEGTLAVVSRARIKLERIPPHRMVCVLHFDDLMKAIDTVHGLLRYRPSAVEIIDPHGLRLAAQNPTVANLCRQFISGDPQALLIVEFSDTEAESIRESVDGMIADENTRRLCYHVYQGWEEPQQQVVWEVRKNALGVLLSLRGDAKPLPFIEDAAIPVERLSSYIREVLEVCRRQGREVAMYAHASVGVIHVRPILNLKQEEDLHILERISQQTFDLVRRYEGAWSGEHGDGLVRSYKNREFFGDQLYEGFCRLKRLFDPPQLLNPGKIVDSPPLTSHLRIHPGYRVQFPGTFYRFRQDGGLDRAIEMCTGVGQCRKTLGGTMCPSYMVTRDEEHSTRGRANALRLAISGDFGPEGFHSPRLFEALDLCLECKACKSECPSNVDMARIKAEFTAHYYRRHGRPLSKRLTAALHEAAAAASRLPRTANWLAHRGAVRLLISSFAGLDPRRQLPRLALSTLVNQVGGGSAESEDRTPVVLLADTFTNYFEPEVGLAAIRILKRIGYAVQVVDVGCCGRPLVSAGCLDRLRKRGERLCRSLLPWAERGVPIVVLEPSCLSTLIDDHPDLSLDETPWKKLGSCLTSLESLLGAGEVRARLRAHLSGGPSEILFHGHCHQKALWGSQASLQILSQLPGSKVTEVDSGCCGMAGSFGYEKEHYDLSEKIGRRRLFPAVEALTNGSVVVAPGFSCRSQIEHFTGRQALHPAMLLDTYLV